MHAVHYALMVQLKGNLTRTGNSHTFFMRVAHIRVRVLP